MSGIGRIKPKILKSILYGRLEVKITTAKEKTQRQI